MSFFYLFLLLHAREALPALLLLDVLHLIEIVLLLTRSCNQVVVSKIIDPLLLVVLLPHLGIMHLVGD